MKSIQTIMEEHKKELETREYEIRQETIKQVIEDVSIGSEQYIAKVELEKFLKHWYMACESNKQSFCSFCPYNCYTKRVSDCLIENIEKRFNL